MAAGLTLFKGLLDLGQVAFKTGIPLSTLQKYVRGDYRPSASRLNALKQVYSSVQFTRLKAAGFPTRLARVFSVQGKSAVTANINKLNNTISALTKKANDRPNQKTNPVDENTIRRNVRKSKKEAQELYNSP